MPTFYVYRHIRHDLDVPFYIGMGMVNQKPKSDTIVQLYRRAYDKTKKSGRNSLWMQIASNTSYTTEIVYESDSLIEIENKEKEFINLYGKIIDNNGTLANIENGGISGNKTHPSSRQMTEIYAYKDSGEYYKKFESVREAHKELGIPECNISYSASREKGVFGGYQFFKKFNGDRVAPRKYIKYGGRTICVVDVKTKRVIQELPTFTSFKKMIHKRQDTCYDILNGSISIEGKKYYFKDNIPNEYI